MESTSKEELFEKLVERLNNLHVDYESQSPLTLCYANSLQFDHGHPDFKNLEKLQEQLRPFLTKFL
jgi:hypothetical protein